MKRHHIKMLASGAILLFFIAASVIFFRSQSLINWDAGQFALGTVRYSLTDHTPHPPGYYLFVKIGGLLTDRTRDANLSFILLSALAQSMAALFFLAACRVYSNGYFVPILATTFFLLHPFVLYERLVALTYSFELLIGCGLLWATLKIVSAQPLRYMLFSAALVGLAAGFRPSVVILAIPFIAVQWIIAKRIQTIAASIAVGVGCVALWAVPFLYETGGIARYSEILTAQFANVQAHPLGGTTIPLFAQTLLLIFAPFAPGILANYKNFFKRDTRAALLIALLPVAWLLTLYAFLHFGDPGYLLGIVPLISYLIFLSIRAMPFQKIAIIIVGIFSLEVLFFGTNAFSYLAREPRLQALSYESLRSHDTRIAAISKRLREVGEPTAFFVLRGHYFDADKEVQMYASPDIRILTYLFPHVTLFDLLGVRGLYGIAHEHAVRFVSDTVISIPKNTQRIVIFTDYLHPDSAPNPSIALTEQFPYESPLNRYEGDIPTLSSFEFLGFTVRKE